MSMTVIIDTDDDADDDDADANADDDSDADDDDDDDDVYVVGRRTTMLPFRLLPQLQTLGPGPLASGRCPVRKN